MKKESKPRYLCLLPKEERQKIASSGGKAIMAKRGKDYFREIGKKGGLAVSRNKEHMAEIGRKGGASRRRKDNAQ